MLSATEIAAFASPDVHVMQGYKSAAISGSHATMELE